MTRRGWVLFAALSLIWGIPYLLIKIAVTDVDPLVVAFGRTLIGALILLRSPCTDACWVRCSGAGRCCCSTR